MSNADAGAPEVLAFCCLKKGNQPGHFYSSGVLQIAGLAIFRKFELTNIFAAFIIPLLRP